MLRKLSYGSVTVFWLDREALPAQVEKAAAMIVADGALGVVLYGSLANGEAVAGSDVDLLVIADVDGPWWRRGDAYQSHFEDLDVPVDGIVATAEELGLPLPAQAIKHGILLAGDLPGTRRRDGTSTS